MLTESGILLTFQSMDTLSNGDVFLHGVEMKGSTPAPREPERGYEPTVHTQRKAFKPKVEPRIGVMCPSCHQSRILFYDLNKGDTGQYQMAMMFAFDEKRLYWFHSKQIIDCIESVPVDANDVNDAWEPDFVWAEELREFLKGPDKYFISMMEASETTLQDIASEWASDKKAKCPICGGVHTIQEWINEYAFPTAGFHDICKICGGEMAMDCKDGFIGAADTQPMKCEVCQYEDSRNLKPKA